MNKLIIFTLIVLIVFPVSAFAQTTSWYDSTMNYRHQITINSSQISGNTNLSNFPLLVSIQNGLNLNQNNIQSDGVDIRFYDNSGNPLDFEIESFSTNNISGSLTAWVLIPSLSTSVDTTIWMYHGNITATNAQNPSSVWVNRDFVYHFSDNSSIVKNSIGTDSTSTSTTTVTGKIGNGINVANNNQWVKFVTTDWTSQTQQDSFSISMWSKSSDTSRGILFGSYNSIPAMNFEYNVLGLLRFYSTTSDPNTDVYATSSDLGDNTWHYLVYSYSASDNTGRVYIDGSQVLTHTKNDANTLFFDSSNNWYLSRDSRTSVSSFPTIFDNLEKIQYALSQDEITTLYQNQNSPSTFLTILTMENKPITTTIPITPTTNNSIDTGLFLLMLVTSMICLVLSLRFGTAFLFITIILMLTLGIILISGYSVVSTETVTVNTDTFTTKKYLINNNGAWLGWAFLIFAILSLVTFFDRTFRGK